MGQSQSKNNQSVDLSLNHPKFQNATLVTTDGQRTMKTTVGIDEKDYDKWKTQIKDLQTHNTQFLLQPTKQQFSSKGLCGSSGTATLNYDDFPHLLSSEIEDRKGSRKGFEEKELWYLLFGLTHAKSNMEPAFSKIGDVRPQNIFINDKGQIKVSNLHSWPREISNFSKSFENQITYLAPQQMHQLETGRTEGEQNNNSETFSIGLTVLSAALLEDFSSLYNLKNYAFDFQKFSQKVNEFKISNKFSDIFKGTVANLLEANPEKRVTPPQLWDFLNPHHSKIKNKEDFIIENAPIKLHNEVLEVREAIPMILKSFGLIQERPEIAELSSSPPPQQVIIHSRQGSLNREKLNFPPPIVRSSVPEKYTQLYKQNITPERNTVQFQNSTQIESVYIPANQIGTEVNQATKITTIEKPVEIVQEQHISDRNSPTK